MKLIDEFKSFAMKGNVVDLAVGIIIGGAFGKIVTSFVNDVIMPPVGLLLGGVDFSHLSVTLKEAVEKTATAKEIPAVILRYGAFINTIIDFLIVAFSIFMMIKALNVMKRKQESAPKAPPSPSEEVQILIQIRDALKK